MEREKLGKAISPSIFFFFLAKAPLSWFLLSTLVDEEDVGERLKSALIGLSGSLVLALVCFSLVPGLRLPSEAGHRGKNTKKKNYSSTAFLLPRRA